MIYGVYLSFHSKESFLAAFADLKKTGWVCESFTPYAVEETLEAETSPLKNAVKVSALVGAVTGLITGFGMQWFADVFYSPMNVGGRPLNSWPAFVPVTWVLTVLVAALSTFISLWWRLGLPRPYHAVFNAKAYGLMPGKFGILIRTTRTNIYLPTLEEVKHLNADSYEEVPC